MQRTCSDAQNPNQTGGGSSSYFRYGTSAHNCGGRCIIKAEVVNQGGESRIVRFLTDETQTAYNGEPTNGPDAAANPTKATFNSTQARACSRCRGYKGRLYHPGRLKYPLKQTKIRGDATGFVRVSWKEAIDDITARLKAVKGKYGNTAFHSIYACGNIASPYQGGGYTGVFSSFDFADQSAALRLLGGSTAYTSDYSFHQGSYMGGYGTAFSGMINMAPSPADMAQNNKYMVMWGSNIPTTHNPKAYSWVKSMEEMKARGGKVIFIGPELSEVGIASADEWIQIRPYTDTALVLGMLYHMLDNTLKNTEPKLDLDYLDTMVYGFFDSPEYWVKVRSTVETDTAPLGTIVLSAPAAIADYNHVAAIAGGSLAKYLLGSADTRLDSIAYSDADSYVSTTFGTKTRGTAYVAPLNNAGSPLTKEAGTSFEYKTTAGAAYKYKTALGEAKTPAWAAAITGIPEAKIKELAEMYMNAGKNNEPIYNEWAGGQLKQAEGCMTLFAIQSLLIISKNWGLPGTGIVNNALGVSKKTDPNEINAYAMMPMGWHTVPPMMSNHPKPSVAQWHNAIKFAFSDKFAAGYKPNVVDETEPTDIGTKKVYYDDGGVKALIDWGAAPGTTPVPFTAGGGEYFKWKGWVDTNATLPVDENPATTANLSGFRFVFNSAGNIPINQHANTIDSMRMFEALPTHGYGTNTAEMADAFYLVTLDNFMSPSARYSDYVLPGKTTWEQEDFLSIENSGTLYVDSVIAGPGESKSSFDFARDWIKAYAGEADAAKFTGIDANSTFKDYFQKVYNETVRTNPTSPFFNKNWDEFLQKPISHAAPNLAAAKSILGDRHETRKGLDAYLEGDKSKPFFADIMTADAFVSSGVYGFNGGDFAKPKDCPEQSKRFHVYSGSLVWRYEHLYDKWHGYLPLTKQGQSNKDADTTAPNPKVWPIPMYFDYQDYFWEAYGLTKADDLGTNGYNLLMTTTHDRFRAHSSQAENPYLRELTHRVVGGDLYSGNDWNQYAVSSDPQGDMNKFTPINELIGPDGLPVSAPSRKKASYADIWINDKDAASGALFGNTPLKDGDLVKVENPIGKVYCTVRTSSRCIPGFVGLHQGCWSDYREIGGETIDVGGNCNTLMASRPSRIDHGNAQQSAMVKISKIQG